MVINRTWFWWDLLFSLNFGVAMFMAMAQSRPFRHEAETLATTLKAVGIGAVSGLLFLAVGLLLVAIYVKLKPVSEKVSFTAVPLRVLIGMTIGGAVGATFYVALLGDFPVVFLDYHGVILYFSGAVGSCVGAVIGAVSSTHSLSLGIRILVVVVSGLTGAVVGIFLAAFFVALFTTPFTGQFKIDW